MERKHFKRTINCPAASDDIRRTYARREMLAAGHEERLREIKNMHLHEKPVRTRRSYNSNCKVRVKNVSVERQTGPYVIIWGKKVYIPEDKVEATMACGMRVYLD